MKLPWDKLIGLTTDGAPAMCGERSGLVRRMRVKMQEDHCIIHQEALCGKVLKMDHLQGRDRMITDMYDAVKLLLWEKQMHQSNLPHFPCCQVMLNQVGATLFINTHFADKLSALRTELARRFGDSEKQKKNFELLRKPFAVDVETAPVQVQMELIELQCNETLKAKYDTAGPTEFIHSIPAAAPQLRLHAARTLCMFGGTYLCEKLFSVMKTNKTAHRSRLPDEHLQSILRVSTTRDLMPNINERVAKKKMPSIQL
ncbi:hypothetical protein SRHO_G00097430 [Serrasalmus rhombeus]